MLSPCNGRLRTNGQLALLSTVRKMPDNCNAHRPGIDAGDLLSEAQFGKIADAANSPAVVLSKSRKHLFDVPGPQFQRDGSKLLVPA